MKNKTFSKVMAAATGFWAAVQVAAAGAQVPDPAPDASIPGGAIISQVIGWAKYGALAICGIVVIAGGAMWAGGQHGGFGGGREADGKKLVLGGLIGAVIVAIAITATNGVFGAAS